MICIYFYISVFLCPYIIEVGGPNFSQQHDWSNLRARQKQTTHDPRPCSL